MEQSQRSPSDLKEEFAKLLEEYQRNRKQLEELQAKKKELLHEVSSTRKRRRQNLALPLSSDELVGVSFVPRLSKWAKKLTIVGYYPPNLVRRNPNSGLWDIRNSLTLGCFAVLLEDSKNTNTLNSTVHISAQELFIEEMPVGLAGDYPKLIEEQLRAGNYESAEHARKRSNTLEQ